MSLQPEDTVIDLTSSFTIVVHDASSKNIIELDSDDSFTLSPERKKPKSKKPSKRKSDKEIKISQGTPKRLAKDRTSSKFGDCAICWDELGTNPLASTKCGHVYCLKCLKKSLKIDKACPSCRTKLSGKLAYHPLYLNKYKEDTE